MNGLRPIVIGLALVGGVSCFEGAKPIPLPDGDVDAFPEGEDRIDGEGEGDVHVDVPPGCGNGTVDGDEECDDGNLTDGDGCDSDCRFSCRDDPDCLDGDLCNGSETCDQIAHRCAAGEATDDGVVCRQTPRSICLSGVCLPSSCGDGVVDTGGGESCEPPGEGNCLGSCRRSCDGDGDCPDDLNVCNGSERCVTEEGACGSSGAMQNGELCATEPPRICIAETCQPSLCGDAFTDFLASEECDDGNGAEGDGCDNDCRFSCGEDAECEDGVGCTDNVCDIARHVCGYPVSAAGTLCRGIQGDCDVEETCDGGSTACPADATLLPTVVCRPSAGPCDIAESCTGDSPACPVDAFAEAGATCDDLNMCTESSACDAGGRCTGTPRSELFGVSMLCSGGFHACALVEGGGLKCWGGNYMGQLGDGTTSASSVPVDVAGLSGPATAVACGFESTCALLGTGEVMCWGSNDSGALGVDVSVTQSPTPVSVEGLELDVIGLFSGDYHFCAIVVGGAVRCWGRNDAGQLGDGTTTQSHVPVAVSGLTAAALGGDGGRDHSCAALTGGSVMCWGDNGYGQIGVSSLDSSLTAVLVPIIGGSAVALAAGRYHTCALFSGGPVLCWGDNSYGQIGDGTNNDAFDPVAVSGMASGTASLSLGSYHSCATTADGGARCWGRNEYSQLGNGLTANSNVPVNVLGLSGVVSGLAPGQSHTCALLDAGSVRCWGRNDRGQLGDGSTTDRGSPVTVVCQ